jgi:hypothetical protein
MLCRENEMTMHFKKGNTYKDSISTEKILRYLERIKREDGKEWLRDRSSQSLSCKEMYNLQPSNMGLTVQPQDAVF